MKLRCPRCQHKLSVPDKYAGRGVRCPACNKPFNVPRIRTAEQGGPDRAALDLEGLASLEAQSSEMGAKELAAAQAVLRQQAAKAGGDRKVRTCPNCQKETAVDDPYLEILCSHCWSPIPALVKGSAPGKGPVSAGQTLRATRTGGFYAELSSCLAYPIPAMGSILTAAAAAFLAGLVPLAVMTGLSHVMEQGTVGTPEGVQKADLSGLAIMVLGIFGAELFFFAAVAMHMFLDVIRASAVGTERPPNLVWNPSQWGNSFVGYLVLVVYFAVMVAGLLTLTLPDGVRVLLETRDAMAVMRQAGGGLLVGLIVICFGIPMNLMGMALGTVPQAINPVRVLRSIAQTHAHYVFLVLVVSVYGVFFGGAFWTIVHDWFLPRIGGLAAGARTGDLVKVAMALASWGLVMAFYFYGTYVLARLHGLFTRSFREELAFGTP